MPAQPPPWNIRHDPAAVRSAFEKPPLPVRAVARVLDARIRKALPGVKLGIKWSVPFYYLKGPVCYLSPAARHVTLGFAQGARIPDESGRLTGTGKSPIRKAVFKDPGEVQAAPLAAWLRAAGRLDREWGRDL